MVALPLGAQHLGPQERRDKATLEALRSGPDLGGLEVVVVRVQLAATGQAQLEGLVAQARQL